MLDKRKFLLYFFVVLIIFSGILTAQEIDTDPRTITVVEGQENVSLLCRTGQPIELCGIAIPGETPSSLSPERPSVTPGLEYFGKGWAAGQCGVTISKIKQANDGQMKCTLYVNSLEKVGFIDIVVAIPPRTPEIEVARNSNSRDSYFELNKEFIARCISRDGRPAANLSWMLDDEPLFEGISNPIHTELNNDRNNRSLFTVEQEIRRYIRADDDGKTLTCRASHFALKDGFEDARMQINVNYQPQVLPELSIYGLELDKTALLHMIIKSNPMPRIEWTIDGVSIAQGTINGRYQAYEPLPMGRGEYNVTLSIAGLTLEDTTKTYHLKASNLLGYQDYTMTISSSGSSIEDGGLGVGGIIGIVLACLIVVVAIALIIVARATGRWCFAASSPTGAAKMSETTEGVGENLLNTSSTVYSTSPVVSNSSPTNTSSVYNETTVPITSSNRPRPLFGQASPQLSVSSRSSNYLGSENQAPVGDYNELGLPPAKAVRWIPSQQRELLEKQAKLLVNTGSKSTDIY